MVIVDNDRLHLTHAIKIKWTSLLCSNTNFSYANETMTCFPNDDVFLLYLVLVRPHAIHSKYQRSKYNNHNTRREWSASLCLSLMRVYRRYCIVQWGERMKWCTVNINLRRAVLLLMRGWGWQTAGYGGTIFLSLTFGGKTTAWNTHCPSPPDCGKAGLGFPAPSRLSRL